MKLPAVPENLPTMIAFVRECARKRGFDEERISEVELAVEEAVTNICLHAYDDQLPGEIEIACVRANDADGIIVEIIDTGKAFNILAAPDPELSADLDSRAIGGLGVLFVRKLADDLRYSRSANENRIQLSFGPDKKL